MQDQTSDGPTWLKQIDQEGEFRRRATSFRSWVGAGGLPAEPGRYHLYVSHACPWAHRVMITRALKGLEKIVSVDVVDWLLPATGWTLHAATEGATADTINHLPNLRAVYEKASPGYQGSVTVPVLWDRKTNGIVNNESAEIIRMLNGEFNDLAQHPEVDLYPESDRTQIDEVNSWVYELLNNGVYRAGFARSQSAYDRAVEGVFTGLERVEGILASQRYLAGDRLTEADIRLFTTLIRFDAVYHHHFKCNFRRLQDFEQTWAYTRELFSYGAFHSTTNFEHIRKHYFVSHETINPHRIVPVGESIDYARPHDRHRLPVTFRPR